MDFDSQFLKFVNILQMFSSESLSLFVFLFAIFFIFISKKFWGLYGLYIYNVIIICLANIHVLYMVKFSNFKTPLPGGTILFSTTFLTSIIITETYGKNYARIGAIISTSFYVFFSIQMILLLAHGRIEFDGSAFSSDAIQNYKSISKIFLPSFRILLASGFAYFSSQLFDIMIFQKIKNLTNGKYLWLRQNISMFLSGFVDHIAFSTIAFFLLSPEKPSFSIFWGGYIIGSYMQRIFVIILSTLFIYPLVKTKARI